MAFGAIAQRANFCTMGAVTDVGTTGDWTRARMWALAIAVTTLGFNGMVALGWIEARNTIYAGPRLLWLSAIVGGAMFGFGMVLASGCGSKSLIRVGGGNLKSLVVSAAEVIHVASVHEYVAAEKTFKTVAGSGGVSAVRSELEATYAMAWAENIWADSLA